MNANHIAGPYNDGIQLCLHCGLTLTDDRGVMICYDSRHGSPPRKGFAEGPVHKIGNMTSIGHDERLLDCLRVMRDQVYGKPISDNEWSNCRDNWITDAEWLRQQFERLGKTS